MNIFKALELAKKYEGEDVRIKSDNHLDLTIDWLDPNFLMIIMEQKGYLHNWIVLRRCDLKRLFKNNGDGTYTPVYIKRHGHVIYPDLEKHGEMEFVSSWEEVKENE